MEGLLGEAGTWKACGACGAITMKSPSNSVMPELLRSHLTEGETKAQSDLLKHVPALGGGAESHTQARLSAKPPTPGTHSPFGQDDQCPWGALWGPRPQEG